MSIVINACVEVINKRPCGRNGAKSKIFAVVAFCFSCMSERRESEAPETVATLIVEMLAIVLFSTLCADVLARMPAVVVLAGVVTGVRVNV